jgi:putative phosphoesterase
VARILHAGDIGSASVLEDLATIAPVIAVRGNVDRDPRLLQLPERIDLDLGGVSIQLVHRLVDARPGLATGVVIFGHSHRPAEERRGNILYLNPGAAGRQGFHRERSVAVLELDERPRASFLPLGPKSRDAETKHRRRA